MLRKYETVIILKPDLLEEDSQKVREKAISIIRRQGGYEITWQDWGKRKLAYPIKKISKGNYVYFRYLSNGDAVKELEQQMRVSDEVLRYLTVKLADQVDPKTFDFEGERKGIYPFGAKSKEHSGEREGPPYDEKSQEHEEASDRRGETSEEEHFSDEHSSSENWGDVGAREGSNEQPDQ